MARDLLKMYGSTPKGRYRSYNYYATYGKVGGEQAHVSCDQVDSQIPGLLHRLHIPPERLAAIRAIYTEQVTQFNGPGLKERLQELRERAQRMNSEEAALARLYAQGKLSEANYDALYSEWRSKLFEVQQEINQLETGADQFIDNLDSAVVLLRELPRLFERLDAPLQARVLQILIRRIIIDTQGKVIDVELNPPFAYLVSLNPDPKGKGKNRKNGVGFSSQFLPPLPTTKSSAVNAEDFAFVLSFPIDGSANTCWRSVTPNRDRNQDALILLLRTSVASNPVAIINRFRY